MVKIVVKVVKKCKMTKNINIVIYLKKITRKMNKYIKNKSETKHKKIEARSKCSQKTLEMSKKKFAY